MIHIKDKKNSKETTYKIFQGSFVIWKYVIKRWMRYKVSIDSNAS